MTAYVRFSIHSIYKLIKIKTVNTTFFQSQTTNFNVIVSGYLDILFIKEMVILAEFYCIRAHSSNLSGDLCSG